jgi:hypothetical protein
MILSKTDLNALKKANKISFHYQSGGNTSFIRCTKTISQKEKESNPFLQDVEYMINIESSLNGIRDTAEDYKCFSYVYTYQYSPINLLFDFLRHGDAVELRWSPDYHETDILKEKKLHADSLYLAITRKSGKTDKFYLFEIETSVSLDNTARMIRKSYACYQSSMG